MPITPQDVAASAKRIEERRAKNPLKAVASDTRGPAELLRQASVKSDLLVNDPHWDTYLSYIQAQVEQLEKMVEDATAKLVDPKVIDHEEMIQAKMIIGEASAMIRAFTMAMGFPTAIMEAHKNAAKSE